MKRIAVYIICALVVLASCTKSQLFGPTHHEEPRLPSNLFNYANQQFAGNQALAENHLFGVTDERATLGRVLFFDTKLSVNNAISCGSCHKQSKAFADFGAVSNGFRGVKTGRNSPPTFNAGVNDRLFWDGRAGSLHEQVLMPAFDHVEMGMSNMDQLLQKIEQIDYYTELFEAAYVTAPGDSLITEFRVRDAISNFLNSMLSFNSKYDAGDNLFDESVNGLSALEVVGADIFREKARCANCHNGSNFGTWGHANIGLELNYADKGFGALIGEESFEGVFKIPSLRNLVFTAPYMHDGRFETLDEVIEHYNSGIVAHRNLDSRLWQDPPFWFDFGEPFPITGEQPDVEFEPAKLNLTDLEKKALKAFLLTLTDHELVNDPKFSDPFVYED